MPTLKLNVECERYKTLSERRRFRQPGGCVPEQTPSLANKRTLAVATKSNKLQDQRIIKQTKIIPSYTRKNVRNSSFTDQYKYDADGDVIMMDLSDIINEFNLTRPDKDTDVEMIDWSGGDYVSSLNKPNVSVR